VQVFSLKRAQIALSIDELPTKWYNISPDLPTKLPPPYRPLEFQKRLSMVEQQQPIKKQG